MYSRVINVIRVGEIEGMSYNRREPREQLMVRSMRVRDNVGYLLDVYRVT